ncbi:Alpha/Beta hydrolase protein [Cercophora newfieldiana]|uniref:Carboxylic ester hydrolase n=1 Tax=Cercophora newfieldiana TaxID=92897 RepID=A0AA39YFL2_9PEZI|nr:Alpha/Beta hydrolase protein [Cercophora newfieldiana]
MAPPPPKSPPAASKPAVVLRQGRYVGSVILASSHFPRAIEAWRGIPYAQDTAGKNRFRPPQPLAPSDGTFDALRFGKFCPRDNFLRGDAGEDCLNLNVYRPAGMGSAAEGGKDGGKGLLPVIVYVHGGAFNSGAGIERNMASFVSWAGEEMVGINFNYRVGALGFLPSEVTAREGLLNLGLRDQQALFEWVKGNVKAFGGDPENVTIMGLSAGAHSVGHHLMYYARRDEPPPFAKAIMESGATTARAVFWPTHPRHLVQFREFLIAAGVEGVPEEEVFDRLRELPVLDIMRASRSLWDRYARSVTWPFQPVIDAPHPLANSSQPDPEKGPAPPVLIPDLPINSWRQGKHLRIPVMTGYNTNEGTIFIPHEANTNEDFRNFFTNLIPGFSASDMDALERLYPDPVTDPSSPYKAVPPNKGRQFSRLDAAYSHYAYICPVLQTAHFLSSDPTNKSPVFVYRYAATGAWGTANHGDEAPVVAHDMGLLGADRLPGLTAVSDAMHGAWVRFIASKTGTPNPAPENDIDVDWPAFDTPFPPDQADSAWKGVVRRGETPAPGKGRKVVFGEGNDERSVVADRNVGWQGVARGNEHKGTPVKEEQLTDVEIAACRFWWGRVELSEGLGVRERKMKL